MSDCSTINQFPRFCEGEIVRAVEKNLAKVFDKISGGEGLQNPFTDKINEINDKLSELSGLNLASTVPDLDLQREIGIFQQNIQDFKNHTDTVSGLGDTTEFIRRLGIANVEKGIKEQFGRVGDSFDNLYTSIMCDADRILNDSVTQIQIGINALGLGDDVQAILELKNQLVALSTKIVNKISSSVNALANAERFVNIYGLVNLITTDDCRIQTLISNGIGTEDLLIDINNYIDEKKLVATSIIERVKDPSLEDIPIVEEIREAFELIP